MKTKFLCLFVMFSVLFIPFNVKAECDYQRKADLMKMASNVQINSSYVLDDKSYPNFIVEVSNVVQDIFVRDSSGHLITYDSNKIFDVYDGSSLEYTFYSNDPNCYGDVISTKYVKVPFYNRFIKYDECKENPEFQYCKLWVKTEFSYDYFKFLLSKYKENKPINEVTIKENSPNYTVYIIGVVFAFSMIVIFAIFVVRRKKK